MMKSVVSKWGNSLAIRIPQAYAEQLGLKEGSTVEVSAQTDAIQIRKPKYALDALIADITPDNRHSEVDWGRSVGNEEW
jgi:antitoxin MazE